LRCHVIDHRCSGTGSTSRIRCIEDSPGSSMPLSASTTARPPSRQLPVVPYAQRGLGEAYRHPEFVAEPFQPPAPLGGPDRIGHRHSHLPQLSDAQHAPAGQQMPSGHESLHGHGFDPPMKQLARPGPKIMHASERGVQLPAPYDGQRVRRLLPHAVSTCTPVASTAARRTSIGVKRSACTSTAP
jgi:hypothetical protein